MPFDPLAEIQLLFETGGAVLWVILVASLILWTLIAERYWFFRFVFPRQVRGWVAEWQARPERQSWHAHKIREAIIADAKNQLHLTLPVIKTMIAICPLCGLLGTVTGMIQVFDVMNVIGTSNARAMASGVFRATIPTMAGMIVALSGLYFGMRFDRLVEKRTQGLADQMKLA